MDSGCTSKFPDIASQLINGEIGKEFKVFLGGGRKNFFPTSYKDVSGLFGLRTDGQDLVDQWKKKDDKRRTFITTQTELQSLNTTNIDYLLGLFDYDKLPYYLDVSKNGLNVPRFSRMTHYCLEMLQKSEHKEGFLLFVEGIQIHHLTTDSPINPYF